MKDFSLEITVFGNFLIILHRNNDKRFHRMKINSRQCMEQHFESRE